MAPHVNVEHIKAWPCSCPNELNLKLNLGVRDGAVTNGTGSKDAWAAPHSVSWLTREFPLPDQQHDSLAEDDLGVHLG